MPTAKRHDGRTPRQLREVRILPDFVGTASGSCLIELGRTRVICTASIVPGVPPWRKGEDPPAGWVTAEYGMLPASTTTRKPRPVGRPADGRSVEIQRLIGRVLRTAVDFTRLGANTIYLDCDVLEADGGTRTASITGAYVALARAIAAGQAAGIFQPAVLSGRVAAVSVGVVGGRVVLDLDYHEDAAAEVDMNVAMTGDGRFLEVQGSSERAPFTGEQLSEMVAVASSGIRQLMKIQRQAIRGS